MANLLLRGSIAPDFALKNEKEEVVNLSVVNTDRPVLLVFYPKDIVDMCAKQMCAYQENLYRFIKYRISLFGISTYSPGLHAKISHQFQFTFPLLSDEDKEVTKAYGVSSLWMLGGTSRAVFVLGPKREVLYRFVEPTIVTHRTPDEVINALEELRKAGKL